MVENSERVVLDFILSSKKGEILKRGDRELKKLRIDDKVYNFDRGKPLSKTLKIKFNKLKQTMDSKNYESKEKRGIRWVNLDKNKTLTGIQKKYKATITDEQSAFKNYTNSYSISNIRVQGIKALQYLKYQDHTLKQYLQKHKGMKVILETFNTFKSKRQTKRSDIQWEVEDTK